MGETLVALQKLFAYEQHLDLRAELPVLQAEFEIDELRPIVETVERRVPTAPGLVRVNHDHSRLATRWAGGDERKARAALFLLLTLRGDAILYQGDEIALEDGAVPADRVTRSRRPAARPRADADALDAVR